MATNTTTGVLASNIRALLAVRGLSQGELAARTGISSSTLSGRLANEETFKIGELRAIGNVFGVTLEQLNDAALNLGKVRAAA